MNKHLKKLLLVSGITLLAVWAVLVMILNDFSVPTNRVLMTISGVSFAIVAFILFPLEKVRQRTDGVRKYMLIFAMYAVMMCAAFCAIYMVLFLYAMT